MREIAKGTRRQKTDDPRVWFTSWEALARVLSKKNILLIEMIRDMQPNSVTELAKKVRRDKTNVLRSLNVLIEFEIVHFEEGEGGRKAPSLNYDDFVVQMHMAEQSQDKAA
jgi:predicted transcriptional regulator